MDKDTKYALFHLHYKASISTNYRDDRYLDLIWHFGILESQAQTQFYQDKCAFFSKIEEIFLIMVNFNTRCRDILDDFRLIKSLKCGLVNLEDVIYQAHTFFPIWNNPLPRNEA